MTIIVFLQGTWTPILDNFLYIPEEHSPEKLTLYGKIARNNPINLPGTIALDISV